MRKITINGVAKPLTQWSRETGINYQTLYYRVYVRGWDPERAIKTPGVKKYNQNGKEMTLREWANELEMPYATLQTRIHKMGLSPEEAIAKPHRRIPQKYLCTKRKTGEMIGKNLTMPEISKLTGLAESTLRSYASREKHNRENRRGLYIIVSEKKN